MTYQRVYGTGVVGSKIVQDVEPETWKEHRFGLPVARWKSLRGRTYWITGAGTGYGRSLACALAAAGSTVFLTGRRLQKLRETLTEMASLNIATGSCHLIRADIRCVEDICQAYEHVRRLCDELHGIVNNAAVPSMPGSSYPLLNDPVEYWDDMMSTNVRAAWLVTRMAAPHMLSARSMRVVFITSEAAWAATPGFGMYNVSKAALNSLGHCMAQEFAARFPSADIQINVVSPGEARTEMNQGSTISPYSLVSMVLALLSHPEGGPNGRFFHSDGRHLAFCHTKPYHRPLL